MSAYMASVHVSKVTACRMSRHALIRLSKPISPKLRLSSKYWHVAEASAHWKLLGGAAGLHASSVSYVV